MPTPELALSAVSAEARELASGARGGFELGGSAFFKSKTVELGHMLPEPKSTRSKYSDPLLHRLDSSKLQLPEFADESTMKQCCTKQAQFVVQMHANDENL
jgi:hypothetical protein